MIRSSKCHFNRFCNPGKKEKLKAFILEYQRVANIYINYIWENCISYKDDVLDIKNSLFSIPLFLDKNQLPEIETDLSARAVKCCLTQIRGIIARVISKKRKAYYVYEKHQKKTKSYNLAIGKPNLTNLKPELNSICCNFEASEGLFNGFLELSSIGKKYGKIRIPIKFHRQFNRIGGEWKRSFLISTDYIVFRFEKPTKLKHTGNVVGADQGVNTLLTLSDGQITPPTDKDGHSFESILSKISRKKKGSKAFRKCQDHRRNFINWSLNQLDFDNIQQIKFEKISNINFGKRASRKMQAWASKDIEDKTKRLAEEKEVLFSLESSVYYSQRCSKCGQVRKSNRKGKIYSCKNCGFICDADLNAAKNHEQDLPKLPFGLSKSKLNIGDGFFWKPAGLFSFSGSELTVPNSEN